MKLELDRPIFIVGCPRSGTTLLATTLNRHSEIASTTETHFFNYVMKIEALREILSDIIEQGKIDADIDTLVKKLVLLMMKQDRILDFAKQARISQDLLIIELTKMLNDLFDPLKADVDVVKQNGHTYAHADFTHITVDVLFKHIFSLMGQLYLISAGKKRICEKTPQHLLSVREILLLYPRAKIIHLLRDGRDTVNSLLKMPWRPNGLVNNIRFWIIYSQLGEELCGELSEESIYTVRYEDFIAKTEETLIKLCAFTAVAYEPSMMSTNLEEAESVEELAEMKAEASDKRLFANWENDWKTRATQEIDSSRQGRWKEDLNSDEQSILNYMLFQRLKYHAYETEQSSVSLKQRFQIFAQYIEIILNKFLRSIID